MVRPEAAEAARAAPRARFRSRADYARPITLSYRYVNSRGVPRACCVPGTVPSGPGPVGRWSRDMLRPDDVLGRPAALHLSLLYGPDVILFLFDYVFLLYTDYRFLVLPKVRTPAVPPCGRRVWGSSSHHIC